jgi:hypothetical protein
MTSQYTDIFENIITSELIESILIGSTLKADCVTNTEKITQCAIHCVMNGPVGVNKETNFPSFDEKIKLKSLYTERLTNKMWRSFCKDVAVWLKTNHRELCMRSQQIVIHRDVWPLWELQ